MPGEESEIGEFLVFPTGYLPSPAARRDPRIPTPMWTNELGQRATASYTIQRWSGSRGERERARGVREQACIERLLSDSPY